MAGYLFQLRTLRRTPGPLIGVVLFTIFGLLCTATVAGTLSRASGGNTIRLEAVFTAATAVRAGDDVRIAGVRVGRVVGTQLEDNLAVVTFTVDRDQHVTTDTLASIAYLNLIGQRYVALERGPHPTDEPLADGDRIPLSRTSPALDLTEMFNAFRPIFDLLRPEDVNALASNMIAAFQGEGPTIEALTRQTAALLGQVADRDEIIGRVIDNMTLILNTTASHREELTGLIDDLGSLTHGLARDRRQLSATFDSVQRSTSQFAALVQEVRTDLVNGVDQLDELTGFFATHTSTLVTALNSLPMALKTYLRTLGDGSYLNVFVCRLSLQVKGTPEVRIGSDDQHSPRCR